MEQFRAKIEEYGNHYEKHGFSPVAARVMVYLFLHQDEDATFEEIVQYFGVSKSAVSNALKVLSLMEIVTEKTRSGARKRYFRASLGSLFAPENFVRNYRETRIILEAIRKLRDRKDEVSEDLDDTIAIIKILEKEYPALHSKIKKHN